MRHRRKVIAGASAVVIAIAVLSLYLALRPPYAIRQLNSGIAYFKAGEVNSAIDSLTKSLDADPSLREAYLFRARALKKQGNYSVAIADFEESNRIQLDRLAMAEKAYCLNRINQNLLAIDDYRQYLDHDPSSAIVWNDLAFSYLKLGQFAEAEECLKRAIIIDEKLQAPHWNMIVLFVNQNRTPTSIPASVLSHAKRALEIGPESAELDRIVATLYAMAAQHDKQWTEPAVRLALRAIAQGTPQQKFLTDPLFSHLLDGVDLEEASKQSSRSDITVQQADRLLDPLP
jgi:tetratricopeptide (TPR) repeat protein